MHIRRFGRVLATAAMVVATSLLFTGVALAQSYPGGNKSPGPTVGGEHFVRGENLTRTGSDVLLYVIVALLALLAGLALRKVTRTRAAQSGE